MEDIKKLFFALKEAHERDLGLNSYTEYMKEGDFLLCSEEESNSIGIFTKDFVFSCSFEIVLDNVEDDDIDEGVWKRKYYAEEKTRFYRSTGEVGMDKIMKFINTLVIAFQ